MSISVVSKESVAAHSPHRNGSPDSALHHLQHAIEHAAHLLPAQGPITVFIHHNTLHAFEDLPFDQAVQRGARVFGCQPYLTEDRYREELGRGRIRSSELRAVLCEDLGGRAHEDVLRLCTRLELRLAMLQYPLRTGPTEELVWFVAETEALRCFRPEASAAMRDRLVAETRRWVMRDLRGGNEAARTGSRGRQGRPVPSWAASLFRRFNESAIENWSDAAWDEFTLQALWRVCCDGVAGVPEHAPPPRPPVRHRDLLLVATGTDSDLWVHEILIPFCAAFLDQGVAHWPLPHRDRGLYRAFCALYCQPGGPPQVWMRGLARELARLEERSASALECLRESLTLLGVAETEWEEYLSATLLALPGWGGMVRQVELRGDRVAHPIPSGSLVDFLAVRLLLERFAVAQAAHEALGFTGPLRAVRDEALRQIPPHTPPSIEQRAFPVFELAQVLGWTPDELFHLGPDEWTALVREIEAFSGLERRRVFHLAYERRLRVQTLDALALHPRWEPTWVGRPRFQVVCCLDEREESFRRHLEEVAPDVQTFGAAGFYGVAMYYRGAADAHFVPLCPIVVQPQHWVEERVDDSHEESHRRRSLTRRALGQASHRFHAGTRTFALGALLTGGLGVLASVPLVARILFPRLTARVRGLFGQFMQTPPKTRLQLERREPTPGPVNGQLGYTLEEMVAIAERQLRDIGLTTRFARLVFILGHGSNSLNNPHKSAYDCGACGGSPGAPNGRALAQILNDPRVREGLARRHLVIPGDTVFLGGFHNTCNDSVTLSDLDRVPETHQEALAAAQRDMEQACDRNAHERCRRFMSAPLTLSFSEARQHVEARAEDLAQTRPELGHATNALCLVGRRQWTRGLFLDRRAFLVSYDPTQDTEDHAILTRILMAAVPVCAGITLEYYFSRVDSAGWGCGTKLPHNLSALLGVMDGAASDLRTGLPWQMVEIHEPVRLLFVLETTPEAILAIMDRNEVIGRHIRNGWVQLAVQSPTADALQVYQDGRFVPYQPQAAHLPRAASSVDWYRGWRDHLEFAEIGP